MNKRMSVRETAKRVLAEAGSAGGIDKVKRIAAHGWPGDVDGEEPDKALLNAIQNEACRLVAEYECEVHS